MNGAPELVPVGAWSAALAGVLDEVAAHVAAAARRLAEGWPDTRGGDWADRLHQLGAALGREADAAVELGRAIDRLRVDPVATAEAGVVAGSPRLGDTGARRTDDRRGVAIPQWDERPDAEG